MSGPYPGILGGIAEASDIQRELGVSVDEAYAIQRQRSAERDQEYERQKLETADSVRLDRVADRVAEKLCCTAEEARKHLDHWDAVHVEQFAKGNVTPFRSRH